MTQQVQSIYIYIYIGFKTFFYVVRHLDSIASYLPIGHSLNMAVPCKLVLFNFSNSKYLYRVKILRYVTEKFDIYRWRINNKLFKWMCYQFLLVVITFSNNCTFCKKNKRWIKCKTIWENSSMQRFNLAWVTPSTSISHLADSRLLGNDALSSAEWLLLITMPTTTHVSH
jgi:hypothetical protein